MGLALRRMTPELGFHLTTGANVAAVGATHATVYFVEFVGATFRAFFAHTQERVSVGLFVCARLARVGCAADGHVSLG